MVLRSVGYAVRGVFFWGAPGPAFRLAPQSTSHFDAGAFDKVSRRRLVHKLRAKGLHHIVLDVLRSWLRPRTAHVVIDGATSDAMTLEDMVFQGTLWGPPLWNVFFEDTRIPINACGFIMRTI